VAVGGLYGLDMGESVEGGGASKTNDKPTVQISQPYFATHTPHTHTTHRGRQFPHIAVCFSLELFLMLFLQGQLKIYEY